MDGSVLKAGPDLDVLIARDVMGYIFCEKHQAWTLPNRGIDFKCPPFSSSDYMEWAWQVAEKMRIAVIPIADGRWWAVVDSGFQAKAGDFTWYEREFNSGEACVSESAAHAICLAALKKLEQNGLPDYQ